MAGTTGLEPATSAVTGQRSNQLSYVPRLLLNSLGLFFVESGAHSPGQFHFAAGSRTHSFGTLLKANGEDVKTVQELLRHANSRITLDVYTQAVNSNKRVAQSKVVRMMVSDMGQKVEEKYPQTQQ